MRNTKTKTLVECALMIALSVILSFIPIFEMPQGGSISACSMVPLIVISYRHGFKWGTFTGLVAGLFQMLMGMKNVMYCTTLLTMLGCILLDYLLAYTVIGAACLFGKPFAKNRSVSVAVGTMVAGLLRYLCSFISGILIWGGYATEGMPVWLYSLTYNGSYMIPEIIMTTVVSVLVVALLDKRLKPVTA